MDESFNQWRNPQTGEVDSDQFSEDESDFVNDSGLVNSKSDANILAPDSDEEVTEGDLTKLSEESNGKKENDSKSSTGISESVVVSSSDEEEVQSISRSSNTSIPSANNKLSFLSRKEEVSLLRSPITPLTRKNKKRCIVDSEESSGNESNYESAVSTSRDIHSSTKLGNASSSRDNSTNAISTNQASIIDESEESLDLSTLKLDSKEAEPVVKKNNLIEDSESEEDFAEKEVITINSNSEDDDSTARSNPHSLIGPKISPKESLPSIDLTVVNDVSLEDINLSSHHSNEFSSRLDSLKLEQLKLQMNISDVIKDIECTKVTLRSANITNLPDRGVRLQMKLKQQEARLRDLRYQQGTLSNEVIKLEISSKKDANLPLSVVEKKPQPTNKMFKLPTTMTDVNAMGKKAMETHRVQQALTVDALRGLHASLKNCPEENTLVSDPRGLLVELMPHQKHGLAWLMWREKEKPSGGILADDMGLGKTLSLIALILKSAEEEDEDEENHENSSDSEEEDNGKWLSSQRSNLKSGHTLVVCPATLLGQWEGEIKNKVKRNKLSYVVHHGPNREKKARKLAETDVVITTYNIVSRDGSSNTLSPLFQIRWRRIILDEAHQIRNPQTQTAKGVFLLKGRSRWALTGTPVHNKELDLFALLKFLRCKPFDDLQVWKKWVDNRDAAGLQRLTTITKSLMLRRTKEGLQQKGELNSLTEKNFHKIFITMDEDEKSAYEKLLNFSKTLFAQFLHQKAEKENALNGIPVASKPAEYLKNAQNPFEDHPELARLHKQMTEIADIKSHTILVLILRLRQFCCQPALIKTMLENEDVKTAGIEDNDGLDMAMMDKLTRMSLKFDPQDVEDVEEDTDGLTLKNPLFEEGRLSTKLQRVLSKLEEILPSDDKIIVVSQWVSLLEVIYHLLKAKDVRCAMLTGKVPVADRGYIVEKFNNPVRGPRVLMLSLTAGGVGLNLVGANHLLLIDLHWNPQLERQAFDRIYRVGQVKDVHIYKFITSETIEESIMKLQEKKLTIADNVLTGSSQKSKLSLDDLKTLFSFNK